MEPMVTTDSEQEREGFARRLHEACAEKEIPKHRRAAVMAQITGVTPKATSKWFDGKGFPTIYHCNQMAAYLGINVNWLLTERGPRYAESAPDMGNPELKALCQLYLDLPREKQQRLLCRLQKKATKFRRRVAELAPKYAANPQPYYEGPERRGDPDFRYNGPERRKVSLRTRLAFSSTAKN